MKKIYYEDRHMNKIYVFGRLQAARPPRDVRAGGACGDAADDTAYDTAASPAQRFSAVPLSAWHFLEALDWEEVDSLRARAHHQGHIPHTVGSCHE